MDELERQVDNFDEERYEEEVERLFVETEMAEDGQASVHVVDSIVSMTDR